ncbi:hypothetical protein LWC34_03800 [Kibdelosporangium philippinense]|uniref:Uncharacterized protein n=1 Tax=Kibdelosporangium philippinense TaxID=211113 RepID=A0ABS8Z1Z1_9PSEU|nr:hypothetical protein [Kibdelosporangium philippinense]MCE7001958.1 hypothetical protein [Kibdelosporangium philippinense]
MTAHTRPRRLVGGLPAEVTSFVDRRREVSETKRLLCGAEDADPAMGVFDHRQHVHDRRR